MVLLLRSGAFRTSLVGGARLVASSVSASAGSTAVGPGDGMGDCSTCIVGAGPGGLCAAGGLKSCHTRKPAYKKTTDARTITNHFRVFESGAVV